jgi:uncharacterized SAM-binding protein YcdF (DUF218 family)
MERRDWTVTDMRLSQAEKELLIAAVSKGELRLLEADQAVWVRIGSKNFQDNNNPTVAAIYVEALENLRRHGYIAHEAGNLYVLTHSGVSKARELGS